MACDSRVIAIRAGYNTLLFANFRLKEMLDIMGSRKFSHEVVSSVVGRGARFSFSSLPLFLSYLFSSQ